MSISVGIVGLPNVGKSTLFEALTRKKVQIANYPFATIDPNIGVVEIEDARLGELARVSGSKKIIPSIIEVYDIAGLVKGAHKGDGLGNQFLSHIQDTDAIAYMVRVFEGADIQHVESSVDPIRDMKIIRQELALKDLELIEKRLVATQKKARGGDKEAVKEADILRAWQEALNRDSHIFQWVKEKGLEDDLNINRLIKETSFLTAKNAIYVLNAKSAPKKDLERYLEVLGGEVIVLDAMVELEAAGMSVEERRELGLGESVLPVFARAAYKALGKITFFTTGENETKAWTTRHRASAQEAAGAIHTDFKEKFIRAHVIGWDLLVETGGWSKAREGGLIRIEGKNYQTKDGDVMEFLHGA